jgi:type I restriction enzyme S subunit
LKRILIERRRRWEEAQHASLTTSAKAPTNNKWKAKYEEPSGPATTRLPQLPQGWCWATVDQVGEVLLGRQRAPQYLTGRYSRAYLRVANIKDDRIELDDLEEMDFNPTHFSKYQLQPGDILVSEGQSPHLCGQSAIYKGGVDGLCFQKTLHRFRPVMGGPSSEFAQIVFRANVRLGVYKAVASITTNIAHLTLEKFKESRFPLPPLREQERISMEVQRLLSVVDAQENQVSLEQKRLARLRQSILKWAFEGRLVDQDPRDEPADRLLERIRAQRSSPSVKKGKSRTQLSLL